VNTTASQKFQPRTCCERGLVVADSQKFQPLTCQHAVMMMSPWLSQ